MTDEVVVLVAEILAEVLIEVANDQCIEQFVMPVKKVVKYHLDQLVTSLYFVVTVLTNKVAAVEIENLALKVEAVAGLTIPKKS